MSLFSYRAKDQVKVFRWVDALTFGMVALIANLLIGYGLLTGENLRTQEYILLPIVMLAFWAPYVMFLVARSKWVKKISFITKHGIPVMANGFNVKQSDVERIIDETIKKWNWAVPWNKSEESLQALFIRFDTFPLVEPRDLSRTFAGLLRNKWAIIGYKEDLNKTALSHELGHEIHYCLTKHYDNEACHRYMKDHGLP